MSEKPGSANRVDASQLSPSVLTCLVVLSLFNLRQRTASNQGMLRAGGIAIPREEHTP